MISEREITSAFSPKNIRRGISALTPVARFAFDASINARFDGLPAGADKNWKGLLKYGAFPFVWRSMAGLGVTEYEGRKAFTSFAYNFELVGRYDYLLDVNGSNMTPIDFKQDEISKELLGGVISLVCDAPSTPELKKGFLKHWADFRRVAYDAFQSHELNIEADRSFPAIKTYKELICGTNARLAAQLCRLYSPGTPDEVAAKVEDAFEALCLYYQVGDDLTDLRADDSLGSPNFYWAALSQYHEEKQSVKDKLLCNTPLKVREVIALSPNSAHLCQSAVSEYRRRIGENFAGYLPFLDLLYTKFFNKVK